MSIMCILSQFVVALSINSSSKSSFLIWYTTIWHSQGRIQECQITGKGEGACPVGHPFPPPISARPVGRHVTRKLNCGITWLTDHSQKFHIHFGKPVGQFTAMHVFLAFAKSGIKCLLIKSTLGMMQEYSIYPTLRCLFTVLYTNTCTCILSVPKLDCVYIHETRLDHVGSSG